MFYFERQDGKILLSHTFSINFTGATINFMFPADESNEDIERSPGFVLTQFLPVGLAQTLMHCKNVRTETAESNPKHAKAFARKNGVRPSKFRKVVIDPMRKVIQGHGGIKGIGAQKAMHIVRGHFAEYTSEAPLFGMVTGKFFRAMHTRGNAELGVKKPDYKVKAKHLKPAICRCQEARHAIGGHRVRLGCYGGASKAPSAE